MGKGGKGNQQQAKRKQPEPEEESEQEVQEDVSEDDDDEIMDYCDAQLSDREQELLERINEEIMQIEDPLKLTWAAIHKLKQDEKEINKQMDEEMRKVQAKFDLLKAPIFHKIAKIASGQPVQKQLYTHHELTKQMNVNKNKPQAIPGFWKGALNTVGFIQCEQDEQILENCTKIQCDTKLVGEGQQQIETIKIIFEFSDNAVISNNILKLEVQRKGQQYKIKEQTPIKFKGQVPQSSSLAQMFDTTILPERLFSICGDLQRAYNNSVFYYFYEGQIEDPQGVAIEGEDDDSDEGDEDQDQEQDIKPIKKKGANKNQNQKKIQGDKAPEKPQCKQQ